MSKILISLISDQTAPNLFMILDQRFEAIEEYIFLTTPEMELLVRSDHLMRGAGLEENQCQKIIVQAEQFEDIYGQLAAYGFDPKDEILINLTGGTKMMTLATFSYFSNSDLDVQMYYIPIGKNIYWQIYPEADNKAIPMPNVVGLSSYLRSYGIEYGKAPGHQWKKRPSAYTAWFLNQYLNSSNFVILNDIRKIYNPNRKKVQWIDISSPIQDFLGQVRFDPKEKKRLHIEEVEYLIGGWFEEWMFHQVKEKLQLGEKSIAMNVAIYRADRDQLKNEFDIQFIYQNKLYIIECKSSLHKDYKFVKNWFDEAVYKLRALKQDFGLNVRTAIISLLDMSIMRGQKKKKFQDRARELDILLLDQKDLFDSPDAWIDRLIE